MKKWISTALAAVLVLSMFGGCANSNTEMGSTNISSDDASISQSTAETAETDSVQAGSDMFTERDYRTEYDESGSVQIQLNGDSATASSDSVQISGTAITITEEATYIISGTLDDGMIIVNAPDTAKLQLVLNGVNMNSETSAALYILEADKVFVTLAESTENTLSNAGTFTAIDDNNIDSVIFSKQDLTLNGLGSLTITSPAGHGIVSKDDLVITGGAYSITSASHGLDANDSIRITGETSITIDAGKDGVHAENDEDPSLGFVYISNGTMNIEAEGDGMSAGAYMQIENGTFQITAGGGSENGTKESSDFWGGFRGGMGPGQPMEQADTTSDSSTSMKGIKSTGDLSITGGTFTINSADDSVHSNTSLTVSGGVFEIASGDDAFHADETLTVTAGVINIAESYEGLEALHVDIQGGEITLVATDDGLNAAGGTDSSGTTGGRDGMFGGGRMDGGMSSASNGSIVISGGTLYINASGDGIDANGSLEISDGYITIVGPNQGDTATLDYDTSAIITGGTFIGSGASGMAQTFSSSEQGVISINMGSQAAGTTITITDTEGSTLATFSPELPFSIIIFSSPSVVSGETYTVTAGAVSEKTTAS